MKDTTNPPKEKYQYLKFPIEALDSGLLDQISKPAFAVLIVLCRFRHYDENTCFPGWDRIQRTANVSRSTVASALNELIEAGLLSKTKRGKKSNEYRLLIFDQAESAKTQQVRRSNSMDKKNDHRVRGSNSIGPQIEPKRVRRSNSNNSYINNNHLSSDPIASTPPEGRKMTPPEPENTTPAKPDAAYWHLRQWIEPDQCERWEQSGLAPRAAYAIKRHLQFEPVHHPHMWIDRVVQNHLTGQCDPKSCICCNAPPDPAEEMNRRRRKMQEQTDYLRSLDNQESEQGKAYKQKVLESYQQLRSADIFDRVHRQACIKLIHRHLQNDSLRAECEKLLENPDFLQSAGPGITFGYYIECYRIADAVRNKRHKDIELPPEQDPDTEQAFRELGDAEKVGRFDPSQPMSYADAVVRN